MLQTNKKKIKKTNNERMKRNHLGHGVALKRYSIALNMKKKNNLDQKEMTKKI